MQIRSKYFQGKAWAWLAGLFFILFLSAGFFVRIIVNYHSRVMRGELIQTTQFLSSMIDMEQLARLTGTNADLESSAYYQLKDRLALVAQSIPKCRFAYLTGIRSDGEIYFYADNEPVGSEDESPSGQIYHEASEGFKNIFSRRHPMTEGPYDDRWGTWVSALIPLLDSQTGEVAAVLGVDIASSDWKWEVTARSAPPVALFVIFGVVLFSLFYYRQQQTDMSSKPVLRRLLWPLTIIISLIVGGFASLLWWQQSFLLQKSIGHTVHSVSYHFDQMVKIHGTQLSRAASFLIDDRSFQTIVADGDREQLAMSYAPLLEKLIRDYRVSRISFFNAERRCLWSFHNMPEEADRPLNCLTFKREKIRRAVHGLELDPSFGLILETAHPVFFNGEPAGYLVLGKEICDILKDIREPSVDLAVILRREQRGGDQLPMEGAALGFEDAGPDFSEYVMVAAPEVVDSGKILQIIEKHEHYSLKDEVVLDGRIWRVSLIPLYASSSGEPIGDLIIFYDISDQKAAFRRLVLIAGGSLAVLLAFLFSFLVILLRWTDQRILEGERRLRESESRFQSVVENVPGVIFRCRNDEYWSMKFISKRIVDITGYLADEFIDNAARSYQSIIHPDDCAVVSKMIHDAIGEKRPYSLEYRINTDDGTIKWVQENGQGLFSASGEIMYIDGVIVDITQQRRIEEEIKGMQEKLAQSKKMAAVGKLSAGVAHEIKNPLAIILLSIDALEQQIGPEEEGRRLLGMIRTSAERANKIVIDLLNFSRQLKLKLQPVPPMGLIAALVSVVSEEAAARKIEIEQQHNVPGDVLVDTDTALMQHALLNIIQNSFDAMPEGGRVVIEAGLEAGTPGQAERVFLRIVDNGCGIPAEILDRVFEPFMTTKEIGKGTGLGLSLTYAIIERHDGTITAQSDPGEGAAFTISLPCRRESGEGGGGAGND